MPHAAALAWSDPIHPAGSFAGFIVARYPVTVLEFGRFVDAGGYRTRKWWSDRGWAWRRAERVDAPAYWQQAGYDGAWLPITGVSFWEAEAFGHFSDAAIPNESEWEAVASNDGGSRYPWGNEWLDSEPLRANVGFFGALRERGLSRVDQFPAGQSSAGVWDLLGNASEWCLPQSQRSVVATQHTGVLRGGCWWHTPIALDSSSRDVVPLVVRDNQTGIRLIKRLVTAGASEVTAAIHRQQAAAGRSFNRATPFARPLARPTAPFRQEGLPVQGAGEDWSLQVIREGEPAKSLSLPDLRRQFPRAVARGMFVCVCRWGEVSEFDGVLLEDVLDRLGLASAAANAYLRQRSVPGPSGLVYEASVSLDYALAHAALLCYGMDGRPLTMELGAPLRLICAGLYGYKQVKCLGELIVTPQFRRGWWEERQQYDPVGEILPGTITVVGDRPYRFEIRAPGPVALDSTDCGDGLDARRSSRG